ncbi:hypothetical protein CH379_016775 [Leptospira ellisii]|uniref:Uncharacterized protein n=1 Tax=Leptospira ellisii TaxID=2023197 RepID=A0AAE4TZZ5_9LEPT|nr:hypothetical protein [Leptospira ellisii]MDV6237289.1 hypothetical protein [Leptospira ellisii]
MNRKREVYADRKGGARPQHAEPEKKDIRENESIKDVAYRPAGKSEICAGPGFKKEWEFLCSSQIGQETLGLDSVLEEYVLETILVPDSVSE